MDSLNLSLDIFWGALADFMFLIVEWALLLQAKYDKDISILNTISHDLVSVKTSLKKIKMGGIITPLSPSSQ